MDEGGGAFYGPKISVQARDAIGRTWQMSTIQLDLQLPQRFDLEYVGADNERHRPMMIHRALFGSDRAVLRHPHRALRRRVPGVAGAGAGDDPPGRRPSRRVRATCSSIASAPTVAASSWSTPTPTRSAPASATPRCEKVPYVLVVGDDDVEHGTVGVNARGSDAPERGVTVDDFVGAPRRRGRHARGRIATMCARSPVGGLAHDVHRRASRRNPNRPAAPRTASSNGSQR